MSNPSATTAQYSVAFAGGLSLRDVGQLVAFGAGTSATALTTACLERIATREPDLHAWAYLDGALALAQAAARSSIASTRSG